MTASYKFNRFGPYGCQLAEEYMDPRGPKRRDMSFERWIHYEKVKNAVSVYQHVDSTIEIVFKNERDITMFLLTL